MLCVDLLALLRGHSDMYVVLSLSELCGKHVLLVVLQAVLKNILHTHPPSLIAPS